MKKLFLLLALISTFAQAQTVRTASYFTNKFVPGYVVKAVDMQDFVTSIPSIAAPTIQYANLGAFPGTGASNQVYVAQDTYKVYAWTGSAYTEISQSTGGGSSSSSLPLPATAGTVTLTFDQNKVYQDATQTGNITIAQSSSGNVPGIVNEISIIGDGVHSLSLPVSWKTGNGNTFDNSMINDIWIEYKNTGRVVYNIIKSNITVGADVTPPTYSVQTVTGIGSTYATYNVQTNEASLVKWIVTTSSTCPAKSAISAGTGAVSSNYGSITLSANTTNIANISSLTASTNYYLCSYAIDESNNETSIQSPISFSTTTADVAAPVLSTVATNSNGTQLIFTYNETLGSVTPSTSDFSFNLSKTATGVSISGSTVIVTVNSPYGGSDVPTVSYTPGTNKIQDVAGNFAASFSNHSVTNNVSISATFLTFTSRTGVTASGNNFTPTTLDASYGHTALDTKSLAASTDGYIQVACSPSSYNSSVFGFSTTNTQSQYSGFKWAFSITVTGDIYAIADGAVVTGGPVGNSTSGLLRIIRTAGAAKIQSSGDGGTSWIDIYSFTPTSSAQVWPVADINGNANSGISQPKGYNLN